MFGGVAKTKYTNGDIRAICQHVEVCLWAIGGGSDDELAGE